MIALICIVVILGLLGSIAWRLDELKNIDHSITYIKNSIEMIEKEIESFKKFNVFMTEETKLFYRSVELKVDDIREEIKELYPNK